MNQANMADANSQSGYDLSRMESNATTLLEFLKFKDLKFNIALMGDRKSGKSSLIRQLLPVIFLTF